MPHTLLIGLFRDKTTAAIAAREVHALGVDKADLSVVASDHQAEGRIANEVGATPGVEIEDSRPAARLGELGGFLLAAIAVGLPGTGSVVAAGPLAAELGEAAGHVVGNLTSMLVKAGLSDAEALEWERVMKTGSVLLGVHARAVSQDAVEAALRHSGAERVVRTQYGHNIE